MKTKTITILAAALLCAVAFKTAQAQPAPAPTTGTKVTYDNFAVAETDKYMSNHVKEHPVNTIRHSRDMSNVKNQVVIRENQDILYSHAVVDISEGATLINPPWDLYSVIQVIDEHHYTIGVVYAGESLTVTKSMVALGDHVFLNMRTAVRTLDEKGYAEAHQHQDSIQIKANSAKPYISKGFDTNSLDAVRADLASRGTEIKHPEKMFGTKAEVNDRMTFLIASAGGWGGLPVKDACYVTTIQPTGKAKDGECSSITLPVPPLKFDKGGFFSVTTYDKAGWIVKEKFALNNRQATPNPDGSYTFNFNCPGKPNNIDVEKDWTLLLRFYVPKSLDEILAYVKSLNANVKIVAQ